MHEIEENDNCFLSFGFMSTVLPLIKSCFSGCGSYQTSWLELYLVASGERSVIRHLVASSGTYFSLISQIYDAARGATFISCQLCYQSPLEFRENNH